MTQAGWAPAAARHQRPAMAVGVVAATLLWARAPFAHRTFWAEDGRTFFGDAVRDGWFVSLDESVAGYFHLLPRLLAVLPASAPLRWAPLATTVGCLVVVAWLASPTYLSSGGFLDDHRSRVLLSLTTVLLPIFGFESVANTTNLHFAMLGVVAVVLVGYQPSRGRRMNDGLLVLVAGLSSPLTLGLAPFVVYRVLVDRRAGGRRPAPVVGAWMAGVLTQLVLIATVVDESRELSPSRSITEAGFLFLERVVSFNLLPFWPRISSEDGAGEITGVLVVRALVGILLVGLILSPVLYLGFRLWRSGETGQAAFLVLVPLAGWSFFIMAAFVSGPEPRYAVFPAFTTVWVLILLARHWPRWLLTTVAVLVAGSVLTHWVPGELRRSGPIWADGLEAAEASCHEYPLVPAEIPIAPEGWAVVLDCEHVIER